MDESKMATLTARGVDAEPVRITEQLERVAIRTAELEELTHRLLHQIDAVLVPPRPESPVNDSAVAALTSSPLATTLDEHEARLQRLSLAVSDALTRLNI